MVSNINTLSFSFANADKHILGNHSLQYCYKFQKEQNCTLNICYDIPNGNSIIPNYCFLIQQAKHFRLKKINAFQLHKPFEKPVVFPSNKVSLENSFRGREEGNGSDAADP